jgi:hypothetical protein
VWTGGVTHNVLRMVVAIQTIHSFWARLIHSFWIGLNEDKVGLVYTAQEKVEDWSRTTSSHGQIKNTSIVEIGKRPKYASLETM